MALKNVTKIKSSHHGKKSWSLIDDYGDHVVAFEYYVASLAKSGFSYATRKRYAEVVSMFLDYLYEAGVFTDEITQGKLNAVIETYPIILARGKNHDWIKFADESQNDFIVCDYGWVPEVVSGLDFKSNGLAPNSFSSTIAAINKFLHVCETYRTEQLEKASYLGELDLPAQLGPLIHVINGSKLLSNQEKKKMKESSVLAAVIRSTGQGMSRPTGLVNPSSKEGMIDIERLDFPIKEIDKLIDACKSHRDRALWLLSVGVGLRSSEVKNLRWSDIDIDEYQVWVADPNGIRYGDQMTSEDKIRFKGRKYSMTYFILYFKERFFYELEMYLKHEYTGTTKDDDYVFQYIYGVRRGNPLVNITDAGYIGLFKRAVKRAGIKTPKWISDFNWTPHSLRHAYAVFLINYIPLNNGTVGLDLEDVQLLMGHEKLATTAHYGRKKREVLLSKLEEADKVMFDVQQDQLTNMMLRIDNVNNFPPQLISKI